MFNIAAVAILTIVIAGTLDQGATGTARPALEGPLKPLGFLVGSCWTGSFANGSKDTHCFESMYDGHFVRDRHKVSGAAKPYEGETLYRWDPEARLIRYTYYNSDGGVSEGTAHVDGGALSFPEKHRDRAGKLQEFRNIWRQTSADEYVALTERRTEEGWREAFKVVFKRDPR